MGRTLLREGFVVVDSFSRKETKGNSATRSPKDPISNIPLSGGLEFCLTNIK